MTMPQDNDAVAAKDDSALVAATARIVAAYVGRAEVAHTEIPGVIAIVANALRGAAATPGDAMPAAAPADRATIAKRVRDSVHNDHLVCLEDGKKMKTLKRHLKTAFGMTPEQYRAKWQLPPDYPMTAPGYTERRSNLAKSWGFGRKGRPADAASEATA